MFTQIAIVLVASTLLCAAAALAEGTPAKAVPSSRVDVARFGVTPGEGDATLGVLRALDACRALPHPTLVFPRGTYHFYPDTARERFYAISNNWQRQQRVALPLWDFAGLTIEGNGSDFVMHGLILPVAIDRCKGVTLRNFSIDWQRPSLSQGEIVAANATSFDLQIAPEYPYKVENGALIFTGDDVEYPLRDFLEFDPKTRATAFQVGDNAGTGRPQSVEALSPGVVRFHFQKLKHPPSVGNVMVLRGGLHRDEPGIFCLNSSDIVSNNVNIYHSSGMGFIAQRCENITLNHTNVTPKPNSNRLFSCDADATHFVYCRGQILIENCLFENQLDDAGNVHGIYARVEEKIDGHTVLMRLVHPEQVGVEVAAAGERVRFVDHQTRVPYAQLKVKSVETLNLGYFLLTTIEPLPTDLKRLHVMENLDWQPNLTIRGCTTRRNRARGFLLGTAGQILIENNVMEEPGACLMMEVESEYWFESGPVENVVIRGNRFVNPNYGVWGRAAIEFGNDSGKYPPFERNISIENNDFKLFNITVFRGGAIDGLRFVGNTLERTTAYPMTQSAPSPAFAVRGSRNIEIAGNQTIGIPENERTIEVDGAVVGHLGDGNTVKN